MFAAAVIALLAVTKAVPLPIPRYDAMLIGCLVVTALLWLCKVETTREVAVIGLFHLVGLALELFKVRTGSWAYPEDAYTKIGGVPLYSGFMYAAVGSYLCQAWRRLDLVLLDYRPVATSAAAAFVYANFFTHHWLPDLRLLGAAALIAATWRTLVCYRVGEARYRMPLAVSFALIGGVLWLAENIATFLGAWRYPDQSGIWRMVHPSKFGSWALLVSVSFVLVCSLKRVDQRRRWAGGSDFDPMPTPAVRLEGHDRCVHGLRRSRLGTRHGSGRPHPRRRLAPSRRRECARVASFRHAAYQAHICPDRDGQGSARGEDRSQRLSRLRGR